jgi:hypothetical protein
MKRLTSVAVGVSLAIGAASTSWAGQEPYVGVVGADIEMNTYYLEPKLWRWLHSESTHDDPWAWDVTQDQERFTYSGISDDEHPEVCIQAEGDFGPSNTDGHTWEYTDTVWLQHEKAGQYKWRINLPKTPNGNINIVVQCGLLKANAYSDAVQTGYPERAMDDCAGETGEVQGTGDCTRRLDQPNTQVMNLQALPMVTAIAYPDPDRTDAPPFNLTSFKTPSYYALGFKTDAAGEKSLKPIQGSHVILNGKREARIALKACQPETMFVKIPVTGQINGLGQEEVDLLQGDEIEVTLDFPRGHTMDVYCNQYSVKLMGLGQPGSQVLVEDPL